MRQFVVYLFLFCICQTNGQSLVDYLQAFDQSDYSSNLNRKTSNETHPLITRVDLPKSLLVDNAPKRTIWITSFGAVFFDDPGSPQNVALTLQEYSDLSDYGDTGIMAAMMANFVVGDRNQLLYKILLADNERISCRDKMLFKRYSKEVEQLFEIGRFTAEMMIAIRWENVYPSNIEPAQKTKPGNTFEMVILADSFNTFVVFNFVKVMWLADTMVCPDNENGFGAWSGFEFKNGGYRLDMDCVNNLTAWNTGTNMATPGAWIIKATNFDTSFALPKIANKKEMLGQIRAEFGFNSPTGYVSLCQSNPRDTNPLVNPYKNSNDNRFSSNCQRLNCPFECDSRCCICPVNQIGNGQLCVTWNKFMNSVIQSRIVGNIENDRLSNEVFILRSGKDQVITVQSKSDKIHTVLSLLLPIFTFPMAYFANSDEQIESRQMLNLWGGSVQLNANVEVPAYRLRCVIKQDLSNLQYDRDRSLNSTVNTDIRCRYKQDDLPSGTKFTFDPLEYLQFTELRRGLLTSKLSLPVKERRSSSMINWTVNITYTAACQALVDDSSDKTFTLYLNKFALNSFTSSSSLYETSATAQPVFKAGSYDSVDPCAYSEDVCLGENTICIPIGNKFRCDCQAGYRKSSADDSCEDINECLNPNKCAKNAVCVNLDGSYKCDCLGPEFAGDGNTWCTPKRAVCSRCSGNADCELNTIEQIYRCKCHDGYQGDGYTCTPLTNPDRTCRDTCHTKASCVNGRCQCQLPYFGDGVRNCLDCVSNSSLCVENAICGGNDDQNDPVYQCTCNPGYKGNGFQSCEVDCEACDINAVCSLADGCQCKSGFEGDGVQCLPPKKICRSTRECGKGATCNKLLDRTLYEDVPVDAGICECMTGFTGTGQDCIPSFQFTLEPSGSATLKESDPLTLRCQLASGGNEGLQYLSFYHNSIPLTKNVERLTGYIQYTIRSVTQQDAGEYRCEGGEAGNFKSLKVIVKGNACGGLCGVNSYCDQRSKICLCNEGFKFRELDRACTLSTCGNFPEICHAKATCKNSVTCVCQDGYSGDGYRNCKKIVDCKDDATLCDRNAACKLSKTGYKCYCNHGFTGDGYTSCLVEQPDCKMKFNCAKQARCDYDRTKSTYMCKCLPGFYGDGVTQCTQNYNCSVVTKPCGPFSDCVSSVKMNQTVGECRCFSKYTLIDGMCYAQDVLDFSIFVASGSFISRLPIVESKMQKKRYWKLNTMENNERIAVSLATDCAQQRVYWSSIGPVQGPSIQAAPAGFPENVSNIIGYVGLVEGIAVDWVSGNVFFTETMNKTIGVVNSKNGRVKILVKSNVMSPRGITIDSQGGKVYWTDWDRLNSRIESVNMDGTERTIVTENLDHLPNGIIFQPEGRKLCWIGGDKSYGNGMINSTTLNCLMLDTESVTKVIYTKLGRPFAMTSTLSNQFYYTDWQDFKVYEVNGNLHNPRRIEFSSRVRNDKPLGIASLKSKCPVGITNACSVNNREYGGCKYLCLPKPNGARVCECPDDYPYCNKGQSKVIR